MEGRIYNQQNHNDNPRHDSKTWKVEQKKIKVCQKIQTLCNEEPGQQPKKGKNKFTEGFEA